MVALAHNTTGGYNTAKGFHAMANKTTGNSNIALGYCAGCQRDASENNIDIGNIGGSGFEENTIRIGTVVAQGDYLGQLHRAHTSTYIAGISGQTASGGVAVYVNADGKVGTLTSSARFKQDIHGMDKASEALLSLRPVTFRYKKNIDSKGAPQFGLVAEEVEKVNPDLVVRDKEGKPHSVRYDAVNAMLLNEFLKEHRTVQKQGATIGQLKSMVEKQEAANAQQQKQIEALTMGLQKVSAQLEASKPAPQMVNNP
jgi:trimeric autotransporter adhesin